VISGPNQAGGVNASASSSEDASRPRVGLVQHWNGASQEIRPGDVVWIPPGVKHWHGAAPTIGMTHVAITEVLDGKTVEWMEHVSDEQYRR
jgi:D-lyxose ketol-isomerase